MKSLCYYCVRILLSSACTVAPTIVVLPTETLLPLTTTVTPTIVWFPPTATPTAFPTPIVTPTADMRPNIGKVLFEDDFTEANAWTSSQSEAGSVALGKDELAIAIGETNAYLFSVREA